MRTALTEEQCGVAADPPMLDDLAISIFGLLREGNRTRDPEKRAVYVREAQIQLAESRKRMCNLAKLADAAEVELVKLARTR